MEIKEKLVLLEEMLELDHNTLSAEMKLDDIESWDSVAAISLMALIDEHFDYQLTSNEIKSFESIGDILKVMK